MPYRNYNLHPEKVSPPEELPGLGQRGFFTKPLHGAVSNAPDPLFLTIHFEVTIAGMGRSGPHAEEDRSFIHPFESDLQGFLKKGLGINELVRGEKNKLGLGVPTGDLVRGNARAFTDRLDAIGRIGHTSGWDALAGVVTVLRAWLDSHAPVSVSTAVGGVEGACAVSATVQVQ